MKNFYLSISCYFFFFSMGQAQKINGTVYDAITGNPISECTVVAYFSDAFNIADFTDEQGKFSFDVLEGNCTISTSYIGYKKYKKEISLTAGQTLDLEIQLIMDTLSMITPVITSSVIKNPQELQFDKDIFMRLPGAFNDPSRLLTRFPTVAITNDQANQVTIKGLAPHTSTWFLNSAPIINPNHLSNAGTITDQASSSGGGVNMISGTSINTFTFHSSPYSSQFYDSPAGLSDFSLSIPEGFQYAFGLLGTEASYAKKYSTGFVGINYRYSTLGILSAIGVNLGDEEINFQDLHVAVRKQLGHNKLSLDVIAGNSKNFHAPLQAEDLLFYKDAQEITFKGKQMLASLHHSLIHNNWKYNNTLNYSIRNSSRSASIDSSFNLPTFDNTFSEITENNISLANSITQYKSESLSLLLNNQSTFKYIYNNEISSNYIQQYNMASIKYLFGDYTFNLGLGFSHFPNKIFNPELRFNTTYNNKAHNISLKYARQTNSILAELYLLDNNLKPFNSSNVSVDYFYKKKNSFFQTGIFYHSFSAVPISSSNYISYFDRIDLFSQELQNGSIQQNGTAEIIGIQEQFEYLFLSKIQAIQSLSVYDISVQEDGREISSSYDFGYTYAFTLSMNHVFKNSSKFLYSISVQGRGAGNELMINSNESTIQNKTIYITDEDKVKMLEPYFRIDTKFDYIFGKRLQHRISLDIQNILNRQNDAYQYYDPLTEKLETQNQLGLIPILKFTSKIF